MTTISLQFLNSKKEKFNYFSDDFLFMKQFFLKSDIYFPSHPSPEFVDLKGWSTGAILVFTPILMIILHYNYICNVVSVDLTDII